MKRQWVILLILLSCATVAFAQHDKAAMKMETQETMPFFTQLGKRAIYHLYLRDTTTNYTGRKRPAMAINGNIPAPKLEFNEGDTAEIYVHNEMMMETSIHWHGLILPNRYDGVSYLTTSPIKAGQTHFFKFPLVQHGTYWYHSHTMTQEQSGLYGAFVIHEKQEKVLKEYTLLLSDWTDENPEQVQRSLHNASDWYGIRKGSTQDYQQAIQQGHFKTKLTNEWKRMMAMDVSDVFYDRFLSNGKPEQSVRQFKPGEQIRFRIINGSSSTYFWLNWAGGKMSVVANDGAEVVPVKIDRMIVAVAETYDVLITIPNDGSFEFRATSEDRTGSTSLWLGDGKKHEAVTLPRLKYFEGMKMMNDMMDANGNMKSMEGMEMNNQMMDMNAVMYPEASESNQVTLNYRMLRSPKATTLPAGPIKTLKFDLTGNMNRYVWTINNKTVSESDKILIKNGENIRIVLYNNTMMRHPMHLHGHYFRVLNGQGEYSPLKNTLDIMPMETDTIEFRATESGDWFFHCHILYHMMSGMGRIFSYENSAENPEIPDPKAGLRKIYADDRRFYVGGKLGLESNGSDGTAWAANTRWRFSTMWHLGTSSRKGFESETMFGRYFGKMQWLYGYAGFDYHYKKTDEHERNMFGQLSNKNDRKTLIAGITYTLPMLFVADIRVDGNAKFRLQLGREDIPLSSRLRLNLMGNTDQEYAAGLRYIVTKYFSLSSHYDSDMGLGGGLTLTY